MHTIYIIYPYILTYSDCGVGEFTGCVESQGGQPRVQGSPVLRTRSLTARFVYVCLHSVKVIRKFFLKP